MSQWKSSNDAANSVNYAAEIIQAGSGRTAIAANNTALFNNTNPGVFTRRASKKVVGQVLVQPAALANNSGERKAIKHAGWNLRTLGMGPVTALTVSAAGSNFANGETILIQGAAGTVNAVVKVVTTTGASMQANANFAAGNIASISIPPFSGGTFHNTSSFSYTYNREKHAFSVTVTGGTGYQNGDVITISNATNVIVPATAVITTNGSGVFSNDTIVFTNLGLFATGQTNAGLSFTVSNSSGGATTGSAATIAGTLNVSTGGTIGTPVLGGRAGRVQYETLIAMGSGVVGAGSNTTFLPIT